MRILQLIQLYQIWMQVCLTFWHNANRYETINIHVCHLPEHYLYGTSIRAMGALWLQVYQEKNRTPFFFVFFLFIGFFPFSEQHTKTQNKQKSHKTKQNKDSTQSLQANTEWFYALLWESLEAYLRGRIISCSTQFRKLHSSTIQGIGQWILIELLIYSGVNWQHSHVHQPLYLLYWRSQSQSTPLALPATQLWSTLVRYGFSSGNTLNIPKLC